MIKRAICLFISIYFLGGCTREVNKYSFKTEHSSEVDESKVVLTRFPSALKEINDSVLAVLNSAQHLSLYNVYSGTNLLNYSTAQINFDSLIQQTFQKKYKGKREYIYDKRTAGGLSNANSQILSFDYYKGSFYLYVNVLAEVKYINDPAELLKYSENEKVKELKKTNAEVDIQIMQYLEFLFIVNDKLELKEIQPLYERPILKQDNYSPLYQKGFAIQDNKMYVPIQNNNQSFENISSKLKTDAETNTLAILDNQKLSSTDYRLDFKTIDFNGFSLQNYFSSYFVFGNHSGTLLFSNGKEICEIESGIKVFPRSMLQENEWIQSFYMDNAKSMVLTTYTLDKKINPTEIEKNYALDSISSIQIKVFDRQKSEWKKEKQLPVTKNLSMLTASDKVLFFVKDNQHYYLKYISYNED